MESSFEHKTLPVTSVASGKVQEVAPVLYMYTDQIVNLFFVGTADRWVLVDAGMPDSARQIFATAEELFGSGAKPDAIVLTHGHFDHIGSIIQLVEHWQAPVYAHELELPYLRGLANYPEPDPGSDEGLVAKMSPLFPKSGINLGEHVSALAEGGLLDRMPGWRWIHTPGHSPGHISLFRDSDRALIAGDAFVATKQESLYQVITQHKEINGPPKYFTTDWAAAKASVRKLNELRPSVAATGHGRPMAGPELAQALDRLARDFDELAVPRHGRFVESGNRS